MIDVTIQNYRYTINDINEIRMWVSDQDITSDAPFFYQPDHPDARPWVDTAEAQAWVENRIAELLAPPIEVIQNTVEE